MLLPITLTLAAACAFLNIWLAGRCGRIRMKAGIMHGDGGNILLGRRMRAHANFTEYAPIVLILLGLVEMALGTSLWLWLPAFAFLIARVAHGFGMDADRPTLWRAGGMIVTILVTIGLAITALFAAYNAAQEVPAPPAMAATL